SSRATRSAWESAGEAFLHLGVPCAARASRRKPAVAACHSARAAAEQTGYAGDMLTAVSNAWDGPRHPCGRSSHLRSVNRTIPAFHVSCLAALWCRDHHVAGDNDGPEDTDPV